MNRFVSSSINSIQKKSESRRIKKNERIIVNLNIEIKSKEKMKELNNEYSKEKSEKLKSKSESELSFETSNLSDDDLSDDDLSDNESDKPVRSQETSRKTVSKLASLMSEKKRKDINSSCHILNLLF